MTFNGIKGLAALEVVSAQLKGFDTPEAMKKKEADVAVRRERALKGQRTKRSKEDPAMLAVKARAAGCHEAREVAGWIKRYIEGGADAAAAGPEKLVTDPATKEKTFEPRLTNYQRNNTFVLDDGRASVPRLPTFKPFKK